MILKFHTRRGADALGWTYVDQVARIDTLGPIVDPATHLHRVFRSHDEVVEYAKSYWGETAGGNLPEYFAFVHIPEFRLGREGCGGQSDEYTLVQVTVWLNDDRIGLVYLTQDEAFLMSESGATIDRLR